MRNGHIFHWLKLLYSCLLVVGLSAVASAEGVAGSPFASGKWVKVAIQKSGVYRVSYEALRKAGFENPQEVGVYGYGGSLLSEKLSDAPREALPAVPIVQQNDALYFYAEGVTSFSYDHAKESYMREINHYATEGYYFLSDIAGVKLMEQEEGSVRDTPPLAEYYDGFLLHEEESTSLKQSGRMLVGEPLSGAAERKVTIPFDNGTPVSGSNIQVYAAYVALPNSEALFELSAEGVRVIEDRMNRREDTSHPNFLAGIRHYVGGSYAFQGAGDALHLNLRLSPATEKSYLDYIFIRYKGRLSYEQGKQLLFRRAGLNYRFKIDKMPSNYLLWAIESPNEVRQVKLTGDYFDHAAMGKNGQPIEFVLCAPEDAYNIAKLEPVETQNIRGYEGVPDLMIISTKAFLDEAKRLGQFHADNEGLKVLVMTQEQLFNEFSSGTPDATAYRLMTKYFYDRWVAANPAKSPTEAPMNLLLFGDGAADNRLLSYEWQALKKSGTEFLLTYQSVNSLNMDSYNTDDYFTYLLPEDDNLTNGKKRMVIGVGRFTVRTLSEARAAVNKSIDYASKLDPGVWKTRGCFVADNGDGYGHLRRAEELAKLTESLMPELMLTKVYFDAFPSQTVNGLNTFPGARRKLMDAFKKGLLFVNYTGHGNPSAWSDEQILTVADIQRFDFPHCPLWITATCDFSNFDSPLTSAGERAFLNEKSAAIALYTTTRVVIDIYNQNLNVAITESLFSKDKDEKLYRFGTVLKHAKNKMISISSDTINKLNFLLIGDPALRLNVPSHQAVINTINDLSLGSSDTIRLKALEKVHVKGYIGTQGGAVNGDFNGSMGVTVFDSEQTMETLESNIPSYLENKQPYSDYPGLIYAGNTKVENGYFDFTFTVPKDVSYGEGNGRINLYAYDEEKKLEAMGVDRSFKVVPGSPGGLAVDTTPPEIRKCFLNDSTATDYFLTGPTPFFFAEVYEDSGLNLSESGLGHRITLCIDNQFDYTYSLNDYYEASATEAGLGTIAYTIPEVTEGDHTATLTVWDVYNNMSTKTIHFRVNKDLSAEAVVAAVYPNPVVRGKEVTFKVQTNQPREEFIGYVELIDFTGRVVAKSDNTSIKTELNIPQEIKWLPTTSYGTNPQSGLYLYRWVITRNNGRVSYATGKLVIVDEAALVEQKE